MSVGVLVRVSPQTREQWKEAAAKEGVSVSEMVRRSVAASMNHESREE